MPRASAARDRVVSTTEAPAAIGPYSQAVRAGGWLFTAGQVALDPVSGQMIEGEIAAQATRALENLVGVLRAAGFGPEDVVKSTIFLTDLADFAAVNEVYGRFFDEPYPARSTVQVAALPRGAKVEIELVAYRG
jgi:2-iminobutanoate/2-iminopropanoate deaminase